MATIHRFPVMQNVPTVCFHDGEPLSGKPYKMPLPQRKRSQKVFCHPSCCLAHLLEINRLDLIPQVYEDTGDIGMKQAPCRTMLKKNGGPYDIDIFRQIARSGTEVVIAPRDEYPFGTERLYAHVYVPSDEKPGKPAEEVDTRDESEDEQPEDDDISDEDEDNTNEVEEEDDDDDEEDE